MHRDLDLLSQKLDTAIATGKQTNRLLQAMLDLARWQDLGPDRILTFEWGGQEIRFHLPQGDIDLVQRMILRRRGFYELALLQEVRRLCKPGLVFVDAGANIGNHALFFAKICAAREVIAFEPVKQIRQVLRRNADLNQPAAITIHDCALGAETGAAAIAKMHQANLGATHLAPSEQGDLPLRSLDSFAIPRIDVMKIDVEGMQMQVLEGARATIARDQPLLIIEARPKLGERPPVESFLAEQKYSIISEFGPNLVAAPR